MTSGRLAIVGVGPGDPELMTLKAVRMLQQSDCVYYPVSRLSSESWLEEAARRHARPEAEVVAVAFSTAAQPQTRTAHWEATASEMIARLEKGQNISFVTLGDPQLYSTSLYLVRALRQQWPAVPVDIVPGISAFSHGAALAEFSLGEGGHSLTVVPTAAALEDVRSAIVHGGTLVLMKIGRHLDAVIDLLEEYGLLEGSVFVARAGLPDQYIETDLRRLRGAPPERGHLAVILTQT